MGRPRVWRPWANRQLSEKWIDRGGQFSELALHISEVSKRPTMHWLTPGIETGFAFGTSAILFGLLVLLLRNRRMMSRAPYTFYASPSRGTFPPIQHAPKTKPAQGLRRAAAPVQPSGLLLSTGLGFTPRGTGNSKVPARSVTRIQSIAPLQFPVLQISAEAKKTDSVPCPFEHLHDVALTEIPVSAGPGNRTDNPGRRPYFNSHK